MTTATKNEPERRRWHWLTNDRADFMDAVFQDQSLSAPAKVAAYALVRRCDYRTMSVQASLATIATSAGVSPRRMQEALKALEAGGWIGRKDGGSRANLYFLRSAASILNRTEASAQIVPTVRTETSEQAENGNTASDQFVRTLSVGCADVFGDLCGRKRPTIEYQTSSDGGARPARKPPVSDSDSCVDRWREELSKCEPLHSEVDRSPEARSPSSALLEFEEFAAGHWRDDGWPPADDHRVDDDLPF